ncbi:MAG: aldolase catalytic domain-containing protein [Pontiellaceae bacterium]|nr:aldolase catalytic domain-containing protein [Pontiellaceae bacterium]MBN2784914.1 aldolase catalytic domain-containing protein [Pontiellaceae bacterium]
MATFEGTGIKNLKVRGGVYYWRQKVNGVRFSESLQTKDIEVAKQRMAEKADAAKSETILKERAMNKQKDISSESVDYWPQLKVLDCTIRDGGLMNNHKFSDDFVRSVHRALVAADVDYMEVGYKADKKLFSADEYGLWKMCDEDDLKKFFGDEDPGVKFSVMADIGRTNHSDIVPADQSVIDLVRVACYIHQIPACLDMVRDAKQKGYETSVNLMAISTVPEFELNKGLELIGKCAEADMLYLVDSFGSLYYEQIEDLMRRYKDAMQHGQQIGIHAHNNQQMAYVNTICCAINGATMLDSTIDGLGRGAGNCPTELLLGFLRNPKFHQRPIIEAVEKLMLPLREEIDWGYSIPYMITGQMNEHPRSAIKLRESDKKNDLVAFYDEMADM